MFNFIKKYPKSTAFTALAVALGLFWVFGGGSAISWLSLIAFVILVVVVLYVNKGAGDQ